MSATLSSDREVLLAAVKAAQVVSVHLASGFTPPGQNLFVAVTHEEALRILDVLPKGAALVFWQDPVGHLFLTPNVWCEPGEAA